MFSRKVIIFSIFLVFLIGMSSVSANDNMTDEIADVNVDIMDEMSLNDDMDDLNTENVEEGESADGNLDSAVDDSKSVDAPDDCHYGYWLDSIDMKNVNLTDLSEKGVTDILLNHYAYTRYNQSEIELFVSDANEKGIHTHIWVQIFYNQHWIRPVDKDGNYNYTFFDSKIEELKECVNTPGVYGVHYYYLRFSGSEYYNNTAQQNPGGIEAISYFVNLSCTELRKINPEIFISAALMPEIDALEKWYGVNYTVISSCMNATVPMIYTSNFRLNASWVKSTTEWFVANSMGAEVWTGLQGYTVNDMGDEELVFNSPTSQVVDEILSGLEGGSKGAIMFRIGVCNDIDFNNLTVNGAELSSFSNLNYLISCSDNLVRLESDFAFDGTYDRDFADGIRLQRDNLIIDGQNHIIDGKKLARMFYIEGRNVTFRNIIFVNGFSQKGGALQLMGINATVINCTFIANNASVDGGAVYLRADGGQIINSRFINNTAAYNAGVYINSVNGKIMGSYFENNRADISAGAVGWSVKENGLIDNCTFINNSAHDEGGGAIFWNKGLNGKILNSRFINNYANFNGSAIFWSYANDGLIGNCTFINNTASVTGGAIYLKGENDSIINSQFINNTAKTGGAISTTNRINMNSITFMDNRPDDIKTFVPSITAKDASYIINYGGKYSITLKDGIGKVLEGKKVTFTLNGKNIGSATTDAEGIATIKLTAKMLKTAKAGKRDLVIGFDDANYSKVSKTVKITINKEKTKLAAKNKKFKKSKKVKEYAVTLKNSKNNAIKKVKVFLKLRGKTYKATTTAKGKATFKIKKLTKKGNFNAKVTFKGNSYYKQVTKKVKITVR